MELTLQDGLLLCLDMIIKEFLAFAANLKYMLGIPMDDPNHQLW